MTFAEDRQRAKVLITVTGRAEAGEPLPVRLLMSIKSAPFSDKDGHLEFLGGQLNPAEPPEAGLIRELQEEELTGNLAKLAAKRAKRVGFFAAEGADHALFHFSISFAEYCRLVWDEEESHGFVLVPRPFLEANLASLTPKTRALLQQMSRRDLDPFAIGLQN